MKTEFTNKTAKVLLIPYEEFEKIISNNVWIIHPDVEGIWFEDCMEDEVDKAEVFTYLAEYLQVSQITGITFDNVMICENIVLFFEE